MINITREFWKARVNGGEEVWERFSHNVIREVKEHFPLRGVIPERIINITDICHYSIENYKKGKYEMSNMWIGC